MRKLRNLFMSPDKDVITVSIIIDGVRRGYFSRQIQPPYQVWDHLIIDDITLHDLELHNFLRLTHQFIVQPDLLSGNKIEEMFEIDNPNI